LSDEINFPAFVASLVHGTFDAIVDASIRQMEAFAGLVSAVAKDVDQFTAENVTANQVRDHLADQYPADLALDVTAKPPRLTRRPKTEGDEENASASDENRLAALDKVITPTAPPIPKPGEAGTVEAAEKARKDAADKPAKEKKTTSAKDSKETNKQVAANKKGSATNESSGKKESTTKESSAKTANKTEKPAGKTAATASP
jgi:hypothetical protein